MMKLFIFPLLDSDLDKFTELFTIIPFLSEKNYSQVLNAANTWNEGLYTRVRFLTSTFEYVNKIEECDVAIIPFKFNKNDIRISEFCDIAKKYNKIVIGFLNDDTSEVFELPSNFILYRTSTTKNNIKENERCLPVLVPDHFPCNIELTDRCTDDIITFCGFTGNGRQHIIEKVSTNYTNCNFILRNGFWAPEVISKQKARQEFYSNLLSGSFSLCVRGNGNFSYRFYEALSFGRIPILIDTDCVLPFEKDIIWSNHIIKITEDEIINLPELIKKCRISPLRNRKLWQSYFSPEGYYYNFIKSL